MSLESWKLIFSSGDRVNVEVLQGLLKEYDIESVILNKQDSAYLFGDVELYVSVENVLRALQIIRNSDPTDI
ncbi:MAG TPA: DUF2007 domain-containing protein [Bacteroidales bacterium]|nr:DUF2007 domain-containing protein [Bacteroidales bacterium]